MTLATLLRLGAVKVISNASSKKRLLHEIADLAHGVYGLPAGATLEALLEREALGPTGVGKGVALPHARLPDLHEMAGAFVLLEKPVNFDAIDRQPVDVVFALFAPEAAGVEHLKSLALVSRTLRQPAVLSKLRANRDAPLLHTILTEAQAIRAA